MYYVYVLVSEKERDRVYIGKTKDLRKRLEGHNSGKSQFTKSFIPWRLETYLGFSKENLASDFEKYLKSGSGFAFMRKRFLPRIN